MPTSPPPTGILTQIANQSIPELASQFGTPTYVYDAARIRARINQLRSFDVIRFAQKANSSLAILDLVRREGGLVDCVSTGEIRRAIKAGYSPGNSGKHPEIVYTADIFDHESLDMVVEHNIPVNCGSPDMIGQLGQRAPGREITLRINPGFGHGHSQKTNTGGEQSKHGIWHEQLADCLALADRHQLKVTGIHMHIGSGTDMEHLGQVSAALEKAAAQVGPSVTMISAGGGMPVPYQPEEKEADMAAYFKLWDATRRRLQDRFGHAVSLEIEPGRYLVADSGYLISEIRAVKQMGQNCFYLLDAGFNNLARPILYGAYHPMFVCPASSEQGARSKEQNDSQLPAPRSLLSVVVGGPLCESGDIFTQEAGGIVSHRALPEANVGDFLVIGHAGAYSFVMGSNYNTKPLAAEVLVDSGKAHLIRARQTFEDLVRGEVIP